MIESKAATMRCSLFYWALGAAAIAAMVFLLYFSFERHGSLYDYPMTLVDKMPFRSRLLDDVFNSTLGVSESSGDVRAADASHGVGD